MGVVWKKINLCLCFKLDIWVVYLLFSCYCVLRNSEWYSLPISYMTFSISNLPSVIFFRERVLIYLVSPYKEALPHHPCCHSLLHFISSETQKGETVELHILFKTQVHCEFEWWHNHVSCWLPYSFPSTIYHLTLLSWSQLSSMVFWAQAEITPRLLPVVGSTNLEIFAVNVYLGLFFPETSNGFNQHWISSVILLPSYQCKTPLSQLDPHLTVLNNFLSSSGFATSLFIFFPGYEQTRRTAQDPCVVFLIPSLH